MSDTRRLVFHIGLEKTGTSSLQACLHHDEAILRRHSILYPRHNLAYGWQNHKPLVGCYGIDEVGDKWLPVDPSRHGATVASLIGEIEAAPERTAVISAEHFSSRFREEQISELHADFERFDCRVIIVLRDHISRLCSAYESYVTNGGALPLDDFAEGMIRPGALDMRYADLVAPWVRIFGRDRVELIAYGPTAVARVLESIDPGLADEAGLGTYRVNVSASVDVVAAMRLTNAAAATAECENTAAWARRTQLRAQIKAWLRQCERDEPAGWSFDREVLARLTEIARRDAAQLEARYGFVLEASRGAVTSEGNPDAEAADLLARALVARAAKPWTRASLVGAALAAGVTLRDELALIRRRCGRST